MADQPPTPHPEAARFPVSQFADSLHQCLSPGVLAAPTRPGMVGRLDRYEVLRPLGRGSMGVVLLARDPASPALVALKVLRAELVGNAVAVQRFLAEARHLRQLPHAGIVPVLAVGEHAGAPWFAMPYFERGSLATLLENARPLSREQTLAIAGRVAEALAHAHRRGIIHRDLKPANILIGADGAPRVSDFGLARTVFNDALMHPEHGHCEGTAPYMSPAVARGEAEDTRCDIYSFGAVLYEMLTGRAPYQGPDSAAILAQIRTGPPPPIRTLNPKADEGQARIAEDAMARELRDRYAHMADVVQDLDRVARGRAPLGAKAIRLGPALRRAAFNRRVLAVAAVVALLAGGVWAWSASRPRISLDRVIAPPQVSSWAGALVANWDGDALPDFVIPEPVGIKVVSGLGQLISMKGFQWNEPRTSPEVTAHWVADVNADGLADVFTCWANGATAVLAPLNNTGYALKHFTAPSTTDVHPQWGQDWTRLYARALTDLDGDGRRELLVATGTHRGREPRALICYDFESQTQQWRQAIAPAIVQLIPRDLEGDGRQVILLGTYAPNNGRALSDGTDDGHSYLYAFSTDGELLWRVEGGGVFSETRFAPPMTRTPDDGVYAWAYSPGHVPEEGDREFGRLLRLDARGRETARWESPRAVRDVTATDLDEDGKIDVLATEFSGRLLRFDAELRLVKAVPILPDAYDGVHGFIVGVTNLTRGGGPEIVLAAWQSQTLKKVLGNDRRELGVVFEHDAKLVVLNRALRPLAGHLLARRQNHWGSDAVRLCDVDADGLAEIIFLTDALRVFKYRAGLGP